MPVHHRVLNAIYDNPFVMVAGMGFPFAGYVLKENLKQTHLTLSQKIMHSRVIAQGTDIYEFFFMFVCNQVV